MSPADTPTRPPGRDPAEQPTATAQPGADEPTDPAGHGGPAEQGDSAEQGDADPLDAVQAAVAGEHACVYGYGIVGSYLSDDDALAAATRAMNVHEQRRDTLRRRLLAADAQPVAALPAYTLPFSVTGSDSARELAGLLEERVAALYVDVIAAGPADELREFAADALIDATVRAAGWGINAPAFPGLQNRSQESEQQ